MNLPFKALSDPTRRKIVMLLKNSDLTAGEIAEHFNITKPSISHHLNILKQAGLISDERKGQNIHYSLNTTVFQEIIRWFFEIIDYNEGGNENEENNKKA
ncbi:winged helix-turn-helix transcriptional regulator [Caloramator sp. E03]|nr:winged helix-turn-helix transcriptional regulator [Caloramator sp. E03]